MDFAEARRAYKELGKQYFGGKLSRADYDVEVRSLRVTDDKGRSWRINSQTGAWQRQESGRWFDDDPDQTSPQVEAWREATAYDDTRVPSELLFAMAFVIVAMAASATLVYLLLNATR